jgi:hypothetical protein
MYNTCIDTEKSVMFFKNLLLRIFLALLNTLTWYAEPYLILTLELSDKLGRHVLLSVFNNVKILKDMGA